MRVVCLGRIVDCEVRLLLLVGVLGNLEGRRVRGLLSGEFHVHGDGICADLRRLVICGPVRLGGSVRSGFLADVRNARDGGVRIILDIRHGIAVIGFRKLVRICYLYIGQGLWKLADEEQARIARRNPVERRRRGDKVHAGLDGIGGTWRI